MPLIFRDMASPRRNDQPGLGVADGSSRLHSWTSYGIGSAHFVGHSMGGAIAMQLAAEQPSKVKSMSLICSAGLGHEFGTYVENYVAAEGRQDLKPVLEKLFADKSLVSRQLIDDVLKYKRLDGVEQS